MDVKCAAIEGAVKAEAEKKGVFVSDMKVASGGKIGDPPNKKSKKKIQKKDHPVGQSNQADNTLID